MKNGESLADLLLVSFSHFGDHRWLQVYDGSFQHFTTKTVYIKINWNLLDMQGDVKHETRFLEEKYLKKCKIPSIFSFGLSGKKRKCVDLQSNQ